MKNAEILMLQNQLIIMQTLLELTQDVKLRAYLKDQIMMTSTAIKCMV